MKNLKFHYNREIPAFRKDYSIEYENGTTVQDIIDFALSEKKKSGYIWVEGNDPISQLEYSHGKVIYDGIPNNIKTMEIWYGRALSKGIRMDYELKV